MAAWLCFGSYRGSTFRFFERCRISAMADRRHHGEGEHHQGNVAMPAMPGSALIVIEPELVFRGLKAVLDRPAMAFDRHQHFDRCSHCTPSGEEGEIAIGDVATDQQTARPQTLICAVEFSGLEICQFEILPAEPVYCRATPHDALPCLRKPVSSITSTASSSAKCSMT